MDSLKHTVSWALTLLAYMLQTLAPETAREHPGQSVVIEEGNFFDLDWKKIVDGLPRPLLVIGNPPWVTNSALAALGSGNLPEKSNFHNHRGFRD